MNDSLTVKNGFPPASASASSVEVSSSHPARGGSFKVPKTPKAYRVIKYPIRLTEEEKRKFDKTCMYLRWFCRGSIEPPSLDKPTVTRGNLNEDRKILTEGGLCSK